MLIKSNEISKLAEENEVLKAQIDLYRESSKALASQVDEIDKEKKKENLVLTFINILIKFTIT